MTINYNSLVFIIQVQIIYLIGQKQITYRFNFYCWFLFRYAALHDCHFIAFEVENSQLVWLLFRFEEYTTLTVFELTLEMYLFWVVVDKKVKVDIFGKRSKEKTIIPVSVLMNSLQSFLSSTNSKNQLFFSHIPHKNNFLRCLHQKNSFVIHLLVKMRNIMIFFLFHLSLQQLAYCLLNWWKFKRKIDYLFR